MDIKKELFEYLSTQQIMSLATYGHHVRLCTVYFSADKDLNLYFISNAETEHCKNISINPEVACSIADSRQAMSVKKIGVQITGKAVEPSGLEKIGAALAFWSKENFDIGVDVSLERIKRRAIECKAYKITPMEIKFFNEELFGPEGYDIIRL